LCKDLLDKVGLAVAPGIDFGENYKKYVRISYAGSMEELQKGLMLLKEYMLKYK
jgi:aspartate/methionine/tyrosine aminotransferase